MGRAIAARSARDGGAVVLADRSGDGLDEAARAIPEADTVVADVTSVADCERIVATTLERHGRLDVLVTAAGVWVEGPTAAMTEAQWDRTIDVNLKGTFFACRSAIPALVATGGCIVAISSDYGLVGGPGAAIYCASKFGVNGHRPVARARACTARRAGEQRLSRRRRHADAGRPGAGLRRRGRGRLPRRPAGYPPPGRSSPLHQRPRRSRRSWRSSARPRPRPSPGCACPWSGA